MALILMQEMANFGCIINNIIESHPREDLKDVSKNIEYCPFSDMAN